MNIGAVEDGWEYDPDTHVYSRRGMPELSVTQACEEGGLSDERTKPFWTPAGRQRGTDVHDALAFYFAFGEEPDLDGSLVPYWSPIMRFLEDGGFELESSETFIVDSVIRYAGRYDFVGRLRRFMTDPDPNVDTARDLIDLKLGSVPRSIGAQTIGYRRRLPAKVVRRWALKVTPDAYRLVPINTDGSGRVLRHADRQDEQLFISALIVAQFRRRYA